MRTLYKSTAEI